MNVGREVFEFLKAGAIAHAKWDYEVSMSIVKNQEKDVNHPFHAAPYFCGGHL